ncbi:MAG: hypothetical protein APF77_24315 [Clostridia bacterium BRH_c25]|nr:MAG: hypothetical protein APF77_24315 [Clostridia bacterium BRH_c25]
MVGKYVAGCFFVVIMLFASVCAEDNMELKLDKEVYKGLSEQMKITLTAPSLNKDIRTADMVVAKVTAENYSFGVNVFLIETGKNTGIFTGSVRFSSNTGNAAEKAIIVKDVAKLHVRYEGLTAEALWMPYNATIKFNADKYRGLGDSPKITLIDHDLNVQRNVVEEVQVLVKSTSDSKGIALKLVESAANSGEFTGYIKLTTGPSDSVKGSLRIKYDDEITVMYRDNINLNSSGKLCTAVAVWKPQTAVLKLSKDSFSGLNSKCKITVTDKDMNKRTDSIDTVDVKVTSDIDPGGVYVKLYETKADSGIFSADISFSTYSSNAARNTLKIAPKSDFKVLYNDEWNEMNKKNVPVEATAKFQLVEGVISTSAEEGSDLNGSITITVKDPDGDISNQKNTLPVNITSGSSSKGLTLWLVETGASSGSFRGTLYFSTRQVEDKDKRDVTLIVSQGDEIKITYNDTTVPEGKSLKISRTYTWSHQKAEIKLDKDSYSGYNSCANITIIDAEANRNPKSIDSVKVKISGDSMPEFTVTINETKADSGQFKGQVYFGRQESRTTNKLKVAAGDTFYVVYEDQGDYSFGAVETAAEWYPQNAELKLDRDSYYGNDAKVGITVKDWDMAANINEKDNITVFVGIAGNPPMLKLSLTETGKNTGIFTGTLAVNGTSSRYSNLRLKDGEVLEVKYTDEDNTEGISVERKASAVWRLKK